MVSKGETKMNLAFFVQTTRKSDENDEIYDLLNDGLADNVIKDACVFYNQVDFNDKKKNFGTFNSTDLWNFSGGLVVDELKNLSFASRVVNNIKLAYLYKNENNLIALLAITSSVPVITRNEKDQKEYFRLTGRKSVLMEDFSATNILKVWDE
tara:strand:- start:1263 stop:1721 length:459 start_codon:yes stop_codon:yes gene_type:complete